MYLEGGVSPKLAIPADEPCEVRHFYTHNVNLATATGLIDVSSDRVTKAPYSQGLSIPLTVFTRAKTCDEPNQADDLQEVFVENIVAHDEDDYGKKIRVRWHRYEDSADTWEPVGDILRSLSRDTAPKRKYLCQRCSRRNCLTRLSAANKDHDNCYRRMRKSCYATAPHGKACD